MKQPLNVRREALSRLCQVPPSDVMASESWAQLRISLMGALADSDNYISHAALSFHAKMFAGTSLLRNRNWLYDWFCLILNDQCSG